ncbi:MAG: PQQ-binding-like beta-propeller repeat protein, partial [Candidatus Marinimicrobia bacterium]|nr:PQQ-binding-like beta-propeller repeat protein [Candidatus Neomarinimicrobiota bacterium]
LTLSWISPGDDGQIGTASSYDIRYSVEVITEDNFDSAMQIAGIVPEVAGTVQEITVDQLLPNTSYYFAIKSIDVVGNVSLISNIAVGTTTNVPLLSTTSMWPKYHRDTQNTGWTQTEGTTLDSLLWTYETGGVVNSSPVVDENGVVYFGSEDGKLYAVNTDGSFKWSFDTGDGIVAAPLLATMNKLYIGSKSGSFYSLNRTTGDTVWTYMTGDQIYSSATVDDAGRVFVGSLDGKLYCIDSEFGTLNWSTTIGTRIYSSPALSVAQDVIYVGGFDKKVYAVEVSTGQTLWTYSTDGYILGSVAVDSNGVVYTSSSDRKLYALNSDGSEKWIYATGGAIWYSSPSIGMNGQIYIGSDDNKLHCVDANTGEQLWTYTTGGDIRNSPAISSNGYVYFGSSDSKIYALDSEGVLKWSFETNAQIQMSSVAIGSSGRIYVGSNDMHLYTIGYEDLTVPSSPQNLSGIGGDNRVELFWDHNDESDLLRYLVYRDESSPALTLFDSVPSNINFFIDENVYNGVSYYYRIRLADQAHNLSAFSNEVNIIPLDIIPPPPPENLTVVGGNGEVTLSWTPSSTNDFSHYYIYSKIDGMEMSIIDSVNNAFTSNILLTGLNNSITYYFAITAVDTNGNESGFSNEVSIIPYAGPIWYVSQNGNDSNTGYSTSAFATIQRAINKSSTGDTIIICPGVYYENIEIINKTLVIKSLSLPDSVIIDGGQNASGVIFRNTDGHSVLQSVTIRNGYGLKGGGIYCENSNPKLKELIIYDNLSNMKGGGIYCENSNPVIENCLILKNTSGDGGGIAFVNNSNPELSHVDIIGNIAYEHGGALYSYGNCHLSITNSILMSNGNESLYLDYSDTPSSLSISFCDIVDGVEDIVLTNGSLVSESIITADPLFVNETSDNYRLSDYSPCIGAGAIDHSLDIDIVRSLRPNPTGSNPDLGMYESVYASQRPKSCYIYDGLNLFDVDWWGDSLYKAHWDSFVDNGIVNYEIAMGNSDSLISNIVDWMVVGLDTFSVLSANAVIEGETYYMSVRGLDSDGQLSDTTTSDGFTIDWTIPVINFANEGSDSFDMDYINHDSLFTTVSWLGSDEISGIANYEYALGTTSGGTETIDWTSTGTATG